MQLVVYENQEISESYKNSLISSKLALRKWISKIILLFENYSSNNVKYVDGIKYIGGRFQIGKFEEDKQLELAEALGLDNEARESIVNDIWSHSEAKEFYVTLRRPQSLLEWADSHDDIPITMITEWIDSVMIPQFNTLLFNYRLEKSEFHNGLDDITGWTDPQTDIGYRVAPSDAEYTTQLSYLECKDDAGDWIKVTEDFYASIAPPPPSYLFTLYQQNINCCATVALHEDDDFYYLDISMNSTDDLLSMASLFYYTELDGNGNEIEGILYFEYIIDTLYDDLYDYDGSNYWVNWQALKAYTKSEKLAFFGTAIFFDAKFEAEEEWYQKGILGDVLSWLVLEFSLLTKSMDNIPILNPIYYQMYYALQIIGLSETDLDNFEIAYRKIRTAVLLFYVGGGFSNVSAEQAAIEDAWIEQGLLLESESYQAGMIGWGEIADITLDAGIDIYNAINTPEMPQATTQETQPQETQEGLDVIQGIEDFDSYYAQMLYDPSELELDDFFENPLLGT